MAIEVSCWHCRWKGQVKNSQGGQLGKCPSCSEFIRIPRARKAKAPPPVPVGPPGAGPPPAVDEEPEVVDDVEIVDDLAVDEEISAPARPRVNPPVEIDEDQKTPDPSVIGPRKSRPVEEEEENRPRKKDVKRAKKRRRPKKKPPRDTARQAAIIGGVGSVLVAVALLAFFYFVKDRVWVYGFVMILLGLIGVFRGVIGNVAETRRNEEDDSDDGDSAGDGDFD